jgi:hypothetical protein
MKSSLLGHAMAMAMAAGVMFDNIPWFRRQHSKSSGSGISRSKYKPHQGSRECARRVRQMAAGFIKP